MPSNNLDHEPEHWWKTKPSVDCMVHVGEKKIVRSSSSCNSENLINVMEDILMIRQAFCAYGHNPSLGHPSKGSLFLWPDDPTSFNDGRLHGFISRLQHELITYFFPRDTGTCRAFQKFHELLHFPTSIISSFGMMMNSDCVWGGNNWNAMGKDQ